MARGRARGPSVWIGTAEAARILGWSEGRVRSHRKDFDGRKFDNRLKYRRSLVEAVAQPKATAETARSQWGDLAALCLMALACAALALWVIFGVLFDGGRSEPVPIVPTTPAVVDWVPSLDGLYLQGSRPHAVCRDGTVSYSLANQGTCSWHGGVARWVNRQSEQ